MDLILQSFDMKLNKPCPTGWLQDLLYVGINISNGFANTGKICTQRDGSTGDPAWESPEDL